MHFLEILEQQSLNPNSLRVLAVLGALGLKYKVDNSMLIVSILYGPCCDKICLLSPQLQRLARKN